MMRLVISMFLALCFVVATFAVPVYVPYKTDVPAGNFIIPVNADCDCTAGQFNLTFNDSVIKPTGNLDNNFGCTTENNWPVDCNVQENIVLVSTYGIYPDNITVNIPFKGVQGTSSLVLSEVLMFGLHGRPLPVDIGNGWAIIH